ncbi:hypothetical protein LCM20_08855 [Halobacillus litoralis]|uniref:HNH endonuclease n=1 Tax=Halobacillus litoralis TaxID=45668 RepID=UPI001CD79CC2|nr:hypothetical protein [Halobacillus litoralis]MCA0970695.1 hypothetical protein [Halobacillus litoralis]
MKTVRDAIPRSLWNRVRGEVHLKSGGQCELCGTSGEEKLHAHEVWAYDEENFLLILTEIQSLCKACHDLKHFHHAVLRIKDRKRKERVMKKLKKHFMTVNDCTEKEFIRHYRNQLAKSGLDPAERSLEDLVDRREQLEREEFLMEQDWRFVIGEGIPFAEEIKLNLNGKGLLSL